MIYNDFLLNKDPFKNFLFGIELQIISSSPRDLKLSLMP
jgi:hypothetical protein